MQASFQFPSNGKVYPKWDALEQARNHKGFVSIPFKREGISKAIKIFADTLNYILFQFPSNGKVYPKSVFQRICLVEGKNPFQFPSNRKVYPKAGVQRPGHRQHNRVSIPFKREGGYKDKNGLYTDMPTYKVSIPFKREGGYKERKGVPVDHLSSILFQFPSNGKVDTKVVKLQKKIKCAIRSFNSLQTGKQRQSGRRQRSRVA